MFSYGQPMSVIRSSWKRVTHFVEPQCLGIRLEGFVIVPVAFLNETKDMPAYVGHEIELDPLFDEVDALVSSSHMCEHEALHT